MKAYKKIIYLLVSILMVTFIFYITPFGNQYEFDFFHTTLSRSLSYILCIVILAPLTVILIDSFYIRDIELQRDTFRGHKIKTILTYLFFIFAMLFLIIYFAVMFSRIILHTNNYILMKSNEVFGKKAIKEFIIEIKIVINPNFNQKINIGSEKHTKYIIDPAKYKLSITLIDDHFSYPLKEYCFRGTMRPLLQHKQIYLSGYYSFVGFSTDSNQHLSDHFTDDKNRKISHKDLNTCTFIYKQTLNES